MYKVEVTDKYENICDYPCSY